MLYDVDQAAIKLNVSKQSIYNKIKLKEFKDKIIIKQKKTYIDGDLLNLIKDTLKVKSIFNMNDNIEEPEESPNIEAITLDDDLLNLNKDLINTLIEQLKVKDIQIQELNNRLAVEQELTKNRQVLELRQPKDIKLLEEHFKDLDKNLLDLRERMEQRKETQQQKSNEHKNIFRKIFNLKIYCFIYFNYLFVLDHT
jgi:hypothetical protein